MKTILTIVCLMLGTALLAQAQPDETHLETAQELVNNARTYLQNNDFANAIMVYNQAIQKEPKNLIYRRELAHAYYLQGDMMRGERMITPLLKADEADEETFLVASQIYVAMNRTDEAKEALNKGIQKFPEAGFLYASKGDLYTKLKKYKDAAEAWEKGVEKVPSLHLNYYNLAKVYFFTKKYFWAIYYGEIYANMESFSSKSEEIKKIVFESYKFLIADLNNEALDGKINRYDNPANFEACAIGLYDQLRTVVTGGIDVDNITMLRTRFLLEWNKNYAAQYPSELFDHQQRLLQGGYFDAYNQWLFGRLHNEKSMKSWSQEHASLMNAFDTYFRNHKLQPRLNQYYKTK